ncbi:hypothetical protein ACFQO4_06740 [Saliphagus sp. GCM10025334]
MEIEHVGYIRSLVRTTRATGAHTAPLEQLADAVAVHEGGRSPDRLERVATALHHAHLPKLADANVVTYDREISRVERLPAAAQLDPFLELVDDEY